jgi:hypothetical protein
MACILSWEKTKKYTAKGKKREEGHGDNLAY